MPLPHLLLILVACIAWGFNFIAAAAALQHWPPFLFTIARFVLVAMLLAPLVRLPPRDQWGRLIAVCIFNGALHFSLYFFALRQSSDISSVAIAMQIYVPISALLAVLLLGERIGWRSSSAIAIAFVGVLIVGVDPLVLSQLDALALTLASAVFLALGTTLMRRLEGVDPFSFQAWTALLSLPPLLFLSLLLEHDQLALLSAGPWEAWGGAAYSAVGGSIIGHGIFFYLIRRHPVADVTPYLLLAPILGVVFGIWIWGDQPGWRLLVGGCLVLGGVLVISIRARVRQRPMRQPERVDAGV